jgi:hypothetical protein
MAVYVYAIVRRPIRFRTTSGDRNRLRSIAAGGVAAIAADRRDRPNPTEQSLREHDAVVRRIARSAPAVLPVRFGTILPTDEALEDALKSGAAALRKALTLVNGREQMTLRVFGRAANDAVTPARDERQAGAQARPGTRYLTGIARQQARRRSAPELKPLNRRLAPIVAAERIARHDTGPLLLTAYHLIPRGAARRYRAALGTHALALGLRITVSGPWPPYAFAPELPL